MNKLHNSAPTGADRDSPQRALEALRSEIDAIDDQLLGLIERRLAVARRVAVLKQVEGSGMLALRPEREEGILTRLRTCGAAVPDALLEAIWRELLGFSLQTQAPTRLWVDAGDGADLVGPARRRFGSAPLIVTASREEALRAALAGHDIAILAADGELEAALGDQLVVIDWLRGRDGEVVGAALGKIPAEPERAAGPAGGGR